MVSFIFVDSLQLDISLHSDTLSRFQASQSLLLLLNAACLAKKKANTSVNLFGLTWPWLELMIYHTKSEHSNNYTTVAWTHDLPH